MVDSGRVSYDRHVDARSGRGSSTVRSATSHLDLAARRAAVLCRFARRASSVDGQLWVVREQEFGNDLALRERQHQLITLARECANSGTDVIVTRGTPATLALQRATRTVRIVTGVGDPMGSGFARSLAAPGANITGLSWATIESTAKAKQLELLREIVPRLHRVVMFLSRTRQPALQELRGPMERAARAASLDLLVHLVGSSSEFAAALRDHGTGEMTAAYIPGLPEIEPHHVADALREARWPSVFDNRSYVDAGGLMSYHLDWVEPQSRSTRCCAGQVPPKFHLSSRRELNW